MCANNYVGMSLCLIFLHAAVGGALKPVCMAGARLSGVKETRSPKKGNYDWAVPKNHTIIS